MSNKQFANCKFTSCSLPIFLRLLPIAACLLLALSSCKEQKKETVAAANKDVYYTCSMHPQVHEEHPGNCPICGMKLIAVKKAKTSMTGMASSMQIQLSPEQVRLGNIQADTIGKATIGNKTVNRNT